MSDVPDIIVSGHLCLDLLPQMDHISPEMLISAGKLYEIGAMSVSTGGAVANTGLALHRLGTKVSLMAGIGDDLIGQIILAFINQRDPSLSQGIRIQPGHNSAYTIVLSPQRSDRVFLSHMGANATYSPDDIDYTLLERSKIFHLGYPPLLPNMYANDGNELLRLYSRAKQAGVVTSLDMSLPDLNTPSGRANWRRILERILPYVDIFVPSIEETLFSLHPSRLKEKGSKKWYEYITLDDLRELSDELFQMGSCAIVGFKLGEYGVFLRTSADDIGVRLSRINSDSAESPLTPNSEIYHPAFDVEVVGTTGAGDAAFAALLTSLLRGHDLASCAQWMCAVGACAVEVADATSGVQDWDSTARRIDCGWALSTLRLSEQ